MELLRFAFTFIAALMIAFGFRQVFGRLPTPAAELPRPLEERLMDALERHEDAAPELVNEARELAGLLNPIPWCTHVRRLVNAADVPAAVREDILAACVR